jgi:hypothetical protein
MRDWDTTLWNLNHPARQGRRPQAPQGSNWDFSDPVHVELFRFSVACKLLMLS